MKKVYHPDHGFMFFSASPEIAAIIAKGGEVFECGINEFKQTLAQREADGIGGIGGTGISDAQLSAQEALINELNNLLNEKERTIIELLGKIEALEKPKKSKTKNTVDDLIG